MLCTNFTKAHSLFLKAKVIKLIVIVICAVCVQGECRLRLEAQRLSLTQIHAAQLELLGERAARHAPRSPDTRLDGGRGETDGRLGERRPRARLGYLPRFFKECFIVQQSTPKNPCFSSG